MGFKAKARKAKADPKAKEKATSDAQWWAMMEADEDLKDNQEFAELARQKALARARAQAKAKAEAEAEAMAKAAALEDPVLYPGDKPYPGARARKGYRRYGQRLEEVGPFDLDVFPSPLNSGMLCPCCYHIKKDWRPQVDRSVRDAIEFAKKYKKMHLEDPKVVKAFFQQDCGGTAFYITFDATCTKSGQRRPYEAKVVVEGPFPNPYRPVSKTHVRIIRVKKQTLEGH